MTKIEIEPSIAAAKTAYALIFRALGQYFLQERRIPAKIACSTDCYDNLVYHYSNSGKVTAEFTLLTDAVRGTGRANLQITFLGRCVSVKDADYLGTTEFEVYAI